MEQHQRYDKIMDQVNFLVEEMKEIKKNQIIAQDFYFLEDVNNFDDDLEDNEYPFQRWEEYLQDLVAYFFTTTHILDGFHDNKVVVQEDFQEDATLSSLEKMAHVC